MNKSYWCKDNKLCQKKQILEILGKMCQETFYQMHLNGKTVGMFVSPPLYTKKLAKVIEHAKLN